MLDTIISSNITLTSFLICTAVSLVLGICTALVVTYRSKSTQSFALTLAVLPVVVQMVIMLVNGNIGAGVAVAGPSAWSGSAPLPARPKRSLASSWPWPSVWLPAWAMWLWRRCSS